MRIDGGSGAAQAAAHTATMDTAMPQTSVPMGTGEEVLQEVIAALDEQRGQARTVRNMSRQIQKSQTRKRIGDMRDAANIRMAGACVTAASSAVGGGITGAGNKNYGDTTTAHGKSIGDAFNAGAGMEDADAAVHGAAAKVAGDAAQDASESMQEATQRQDRALQKLDAILQAQVDSSRAVIRRG